MEHTSLDLKDIVAILQRQRRLIFMTVVILLGLALAYVLQANPVYRASALMLVDLRDSNLLDPRETGEQQSAVLNSRVDSEVEILRSEATALAVVQAANLIDDPEFGPQIGWLEKLGSAVGLDLGPNALRRLLGLSPNPTPGAEDLVQASVLKLQRAVDVRRRGLTYLIAISVDSGSPARAAEIANAYARTYLQRQVEAKSAATLDARDVLSRQIETAQASLAASETAVNGFIEENLARLESESGDPAIAVLRQRLETARAEEQATLGRLALAEGAIGSGDFAAAAETLGDAALAALARQREDLARRLGEAEEGTSARIDLASELARLNEDLAARSDQTLGAIRQDMEALDARQDEARDQLRGTLLQSDLSADLLAKLFDLQQSATIARNQYQTLLSREQDLGTLANLQIADARIVSEALPPSSPAAPNKRLILALTIVGGLGFGVGLAFLKEYYIGGVVSTSQLTNLLQARAPVSVPQVSLSDNGTPSDAVVSQPMSIYAEVFRKLRVAIDTAIDQAKGERVPAPANGGNARPATHGRVILVCSALQGEGKTTTAIALARTYALSGERTLLIDVDMRKPAVAGRLGVESEVGLYEYLSGSGAKPIRQLRAAADPLSPLVVLTSGARSAVPTDQMINSGAFRALLEVATASFDIVILDSPPLLPVVDTRYLARHADAVVQVVRYGNTTQGEVREAASQVLEMMPAHARLLAVLSHEERPRGGGYGGYGAYYGQDAD